MYLNHLNLTVTNVSEAIYLFETYFDFKCIEVKGDNMVAVLKGIDDFELVLMNASMNQKGNTSYPDVFHIGFMLDDPDYVIKIHKKLKDGGIPLEREPKRIRDNFGFYFHFDTLMIEIGTPLKDQNDDLVLDSSLGSE
jgi:catechol 2,3-dioxygenase-like lactoylglutathione lyase family enzyme